MCKKDQKQRKKKEIRLVNVTLNNFEVGIFFMPLVTACFADPHKGVLVRFGTIRVESDDSRRERRRETAMLRYDAITELHI